MTNDKELRALAEELHGVAMHAHLIGHKVPIDFLLKFSKRMTALAAAPAGGEVDEAMVERFCASFMRTQWPTASKHNDDGIRDMVREALTAALHTPTERT